VVELVLLPGITVAGIASLVAYCGAAYVAYINYGVNGVLISVAVIVVVSLLATWFSLRAKTWQKFALHQNIESRSNSSPADVVKTGERGVALTRLAPMGKVIIGGATYEAKVLEGFVDQQTEVEVTGFENFTVIVKPII
jgi:membrane-bound ClpP family serine protease